MLWLVLLQQILHKDRARLHKFTATDLKSSEIDCPSSHIYINGGRIINWTRLEVCCCKLVHALHAIFGTLNMENPAEVSCNLCARLCEHRHVWDTDFDIGFQSHRAQKRWTTVNAKEGAEACVPTDFTSVQACSWTTLKPAAGYMTVKVGGGC